MAAREDPQANRTSVQVERNICARPFEADSALKGRCVFRRPCELRWADVSSPADRRCSRSASRDILRADGGINCQICSVCRGAQV